MEKVFRLHPLEEFQLWLESMVVYFPRAGRSFGAKVEPPANHNFRSELRNVLLVLRDEIRRCPKILIEELKKEDSAAPPDILSERELKALILKSEGLTTRLGEFVRFWESLQKYAIIGLSIARHQFLSKAEFKAFGLVLTAEIRNLIQSEFHADMLKSRSNFTFHHIMQRDILGSVEVQGIREELERVFHKFFEILSLVQYCQKQIQKSFKYQKLTVLLTHCHHSYLEFLNVLEQAERYLRFTQPQLAEAVESIKFGLRLEVRRIFEQELRVLSSDVRLPDLYSNIESGLGLLKHASRQSFTSLVRELNPDFEELNLFQELKNQQLVAMQLSQDLNELYDMARDSDMQHSKEKFAELIQTLKDFRKGSMRLLYFKDWQPFEQFSRELETTEDRDCAFILHRLEVYLSTLIGEVNKQAILHRDTAEIAQGL